MAEYESSLPVSNMLDSSANYEISHDLEPWLKYPYPSSLVSKPERNTTIKDHLNHKVQMNTRPVPMRMKHETNLKQI